MSNDAPTWETVGQFIARGTDTPVTVSRLSGGSKVEWVDIAGAKSTFAMSRSNCYRLAAAGLIKMVHIRRPGVTRGRVLIDADSIRRYYDSFKVEAAQDTNNAK